MWFVDPSATAEAALMLVDRYENSRLFEDIVRLTTKMDPVLDQIDKLLDDTMIFKPIRADLARRYGLMLHTERRSTPVEVILRMFVVKRLYDYSYEKTERHVGDSLVLRQFVAFS
jgi:IS5 family transposase